MKKLLAIVIFTTIFSCFSQGMLNAQNQYSIRQEGEFGVGVGAGHYFGDLNTRARLNRPKLAVGAFFANNSATILVFVSARTSPNLDTPIYTTPITSFKKDVT